jgi:hypothetical protein
MDDCFGSKAVIGQACWYYIGFCVIKVFLRPSRRPLVLLVLRIALLHLGGAL